MLQSN